MTLLPKVIAGPRRVLLARLVANGFAQALATILTGWLVHRAFESLVSVRGQAFSVSMALLLGAGLLLAALAIAWLRLVERTDAERLGQDYVTQVRLRLFDTLASISVRAVQRRSRGALTLRFIGDLKTLRQWVSLGLARVTVACITTALALAALAYVSPVLALTALVVIAGGAAAVVALGEPVRQAMREARRRQAYLAANVNEKITSLAVVQVFNQFRRERSRLERQSSRLQEAMVAQARSSAVLRTLAHFTGSIASAAVLLAGAFEVARGTATAATVVAAMTIVGMLVPALRDLGLAFSYWNGAKVSRSKLVQFLESPALVADEPNAPDLKPTAGRIEFREVSLEGSLSNFSAVAEGGKITAIVGPNGSGKSTLLALAARLVDPDSGAILLDGQDLKAHRLASVRKALGVVSGDLPLLRGTVEKNLRYRLPKASEAELDRVEALCRIDEVLADLPNGLETRVFEGGANLSFGQRQRIALARAMLGDPPVLLLDEADANLDARSNAVFDRVLAQYRGTVLIVTHRYERAAKADSIWFVEGGRLAEHGTPRELLSRQSFTARLFRHAEAAAS